MKCFDNIYLIVCCSIVVTVVVVVVVVLVVVLMTTRVEIDLTSRLLHSNISNLVYKNRMLYKSCRIIVHCHVLD